MYTTADLPHAPSPVALRRTISRVIEVEFHVTDDAVREAKDDSGVRFLPKRAEVRINLDNGRYTVELSGPRFGARYGDPVDTARQTYTGEHFLDCDEHRHGLVVSAVNACLTAHGLVTS